MQSHQDDANAFLEIRRELLERFETMLRSDQSVDAVDREEMVAALDRAIEAGRTLKTGDASPDVNLRESLDGACEAIVPSSDRQAVDDAFRVPFEVLQSDGVRRAMEFARIVREEGESAARRWLSGQHPKSQVGAIAAHVHDGRHALLALGAARKLAGG